jgi:type II secretory pathway predicted ATPase ExeA/cell division septation protein DedD
LGGALVSFQPQSDTLTYEPFFGLNEKPFSLNADSRFVFDSPSYGATRQGLLAGIRRREGLQVLTGEIGTGKTTLCRAVLRDLGRKTYSSLVPDPFASREDLLKMLLIDFGVLSIEELTEGRMRQASRTELGYLLAGFLGSLAKDVFVVVIVDEAQNMSLPLIEETRILSDTYGAERLQIVFVGQPELQAKLKLPALRQVDQRVCGYHRLAPMDREAVAGYIQHRLLAAGGHPDRVLFAPELIDALHQRSGGVPRLINRLCDRALQLAYARKADGVDREILDTALLEIGSATLSPTWDAIMADVPAAQPGVEAPLPSAAAPPATAPTVPPVDTPPALDEAADFQNEIDQWVAKDLAPPVRGRAPVFAEVTPEQLRAWRRTPRTAPPRAVPAPRVKTDWPSDVRSETYMQKFWRTWRRRAAIAAAVVVTAFVASMGVAYVLDSQARAVLPAVPEAPVQATPIEEPAKAMVTEAPAAEVPAPEAPVAEAPVVAAGVVEAAGSASAAATGDYLVAVGLFASRERADQLVESLTQAGLPAMQRPFRFRRQDVQQIVLGPFFSRSDAVADLRRLKAMGGYDDASVIDSAQ